MIECDADRVMVREKTAAVTGVDIPQIDRGVYRTQDRKSDIVTYVNHSALAAKYLHPSIHKTAVEALSDLLDVITHPLEVFNAVMHVRTVGDDESILDMAYGLGQHRILAL